MFYLTHDNLNNLQNVLADRGYSFDKLLNLKFYTARFKIIRKNTLYTFFVIRKIWIVVWLEKYRRKNVSENSIHRKKMVTLAFISIHLKRL